MSLKDQITEDMKAAMRAKDSKRLSAIRMLLAALKQVEVDRRIELTDADVVSIVEKELKKRRDSIQQYRAAKRDDLADGEEFEAAGERRGDVDEFAFEVALPADGCGA